jgi:hypothetical protein
MAPWKSYTKLIFESIIAFYVATLALAVFFLLQGRQFPGLAVLQVMLYVFVVGVITRRVIRTFSAPALMLTVPIAPLLVLILVLSMLPVLERLS